MNRNVGHVTPKAVALLTLTGMSQAKMAEDLGVSRQFLNTYCQKNSEEIKKYVDEAIDKDFSTTSDARRELQVAIFKDIKFVLEIMREKYENDDLKRLDIEYFSALARTVHIDTESPFDNSNVEIKITRG